MTNQDFPSVTSHTSHRNQYEVQHGNKVVLVRSQFPTFPFIFFLLGCFSFSAFSVYCNRAIRQNQPEKLPTKDMILWE